MPLVKRGNSRFWYVQFQLNNRTYVRSTKTTDKRLAAKLEAKIREEVLSGPVEEPRGTSLVFWIDSFIASKAGTPNHKNLLHQRSAITSFLGRDLAIGQITGADLENYRQHRTRQGRAPQTIKHELNLLAAALRYARRMGEASAPQLTIPTIRLPRGRLRYLSPGEEQRLLCELDPLRSGPGLALPKERGAKRQQSLQDNYDLVILLLDTGARYGEIAGLKWSQIDLPGRTIRLWRPKVSNESVLFMTRRVVQILGERRSSSKSPYVFGTDAGPRPYRVTAIRKALDRAGLSDCTIHTLRHTHASRLIQNGMSVYEVKSVLGHADLRTTMRYAHLEEAAVMERARDVIDSLTNKSSSY